MKTHAKISRATAAPSAAPQAALVPSRDAAAPDVAAIPKHSFAGVAVTAAPPGAIQPKLTVGPANDRYEDEADRVAGQIMRMPDAQVRRVTQEDDEGTIRSTPDVQRRAEGSFAAGADVSSRIAARRGGGSPLPEAARAFMEPRFGADFSGVRVHADAEADQISQDLSARAFTTGRDIYFRHGAYSPSSSGGQELLAHELTHVLQQGKPNQAVSHTPASRVQRFSVNVERKQKLVKDAEGGKLTGEPFSWYSKFDVDIEDGKVVVTIRIHANISPDQFEKVWKKQVTDQWSNRFMLKVDDKNYPIVVNLVLEQNRGKAHYEVEAVNSGITRDPKSRGHFGTESMEKWGINDTFNVAHEVGHMLGNVDEYGEVEVPGEQGTRDYITNPSDTIMAVSVNNPVERHYYLIKWAAEKILGKEGLAEVVPYMQGRIGNRPAMPIISLSQVQEARSQLGSSAPARAPYPTSKSTGMQAGAHPSAHLPSSRPAPASAKSSPPASASSAPASSQSGAVARPSQQSTRPLPVPKQSQASNQGERPLLVPKQSQSLLVPKQSQPQPSKQGERPLLVPKQVSTGVKTQQVAPILVKQPPSTTTGNVGTAVKTQPLAANTEKKPQEGTIGVGTSVKTQKPAPVSPQKAQAGTILGELEAKQHEKRVERIMTYIFNNTLTDTQEQQIMQYKDWSTSHQSSKEVIRILNI